MKYNLHSKLPDYNLEPPPEYPEWLDDTEPAEEEAEEQDDE